MVFVWIPIIEFNSVVAHSRLATRYDNHIISESFLKVLEILHNTPIG